MRKILYILLSFVTVSVNGQIEQPRIKFDQVIKDSTGSGRIVISSLTDSNMIYSPDFFINTADSLLILFGDTVQAGSAVNSAQVRDIIYATIDAGLGIEIDTSSQLGILTIQSLSVEDSVYNGTGNLIAKGTPLYVVGIQGNYWSVEPAQANDSTKMPVVAIAGKDIAAGQQGLGLLKGHIKGVDTDLFEAGDEIWVGATGGYTNVRPKGEDVLVQKLGTVVKANSDGSGIINLGEVQYNLNPNNIFIGGADSLQTTANLPTVLSDSLDNYVTIAGTETITGAKTFTSALTQSGGYVNFDSGTFFVDENSNKVGIGTTSPSATLSIKNASNNNSDNLGQVLTNSEFRLRYRSDDNTQLSSLYIGGLGSNRGYLQGVNNAEDAGADISLNPYGGNVGIGTNLPSYKLHLAKTDTAGQYAYFGASSDGGSRGLTFTSSDNGEYLGAIHTIDATSGSGELAFATGGTERMRITSAGNVLIGTTSDAGYKLDVNGQSRIAGQLILSGVSTSEVYTADASGLYLTAATAGGMYLQSDGTFYFREASSPYTEYMRITSSGTVGIGTTTPAYKLDVSGTGRFTSSVLAQKVQIGTPNTINDVTGVANTLQLTNYTTGAFITGSADNYIYKNSNGFGGLNAHSLIFQTRSDIDGGGFAFVSGTTPSAVATISSSGNLTLGTPLSVANGGTGATSFTAGRVLFGNGTSAINTDGDLFWDNSNKILNINNSSISSGPQSLNVYGFDGAANFFTTRSETPFNNTISLYNNPSSGQGYGTGILFRAKSDDTNSRVQAAIYSSWTTATDASRTAKLVFRTTENGAAADKLTILGNGNVGIGTTSPANKLEVDGGSSAVALRVSTTNTGAGVASLILANSSKSSFNDGVKIAHGGGYTNITDLSGTNIMTWDMTNTRVGIGTTTPQNKLDVEGGAVIGATYSGTSTAPTNGLLVEGNVGIGTTSPSSKLDINGSYKWNGVAILTDAAYFRGSTTYGFRFNNAADTYNNVIFYDNGNMYVRGNVGIGETSPSAKLHVVGVSGAINGTGMTYLNNTDDAFSLVVNNAGNSDQNDRGVFEARVGTNSVFRINNSGNVGIGTSSPSAKLEVSGGNVFFNLGTNNFILGDVNDKLTFGQDGGGSYLERIGSTQAKTAFRFQTSYSVNYVGFRISESDGFEYYDGAYAFPNDNKFVIKKTTGNVGIGTTNPAVKLTVLGDASNAGLEFGNATTFTYIQSYDRVASEHKDLYFYASGAPTMVIKNSGNVGIGTQTPDGKLDVNGTSYFRDNIILYATKKLYLDSGSDTYLTEVSSNTMQFVTSDVERMRITSSGNVGIGTTSPDSKVEISDAGSTKLKVTNTSNSVETVVLSQSGDGWIGTQTNHPLKLGTGYGAKMTIGTNGNVGIGTTSPDSKLEVNGNGLFSGNLTVNGTTLTSDIVIQNEETNTNPAELNLYKKNGSNIGEVTVGDNIGSINFKAESGVTTVTSASIEVDATTLYNNEIGGDMVFKTASEFHSRPLTEAMRIDKLGMVGIGTSSPSETLDVDGNARFRSIGSGASAGALHYTSDGTLTTNTSDVRLKTNLQPLENTLNKLLGINTYTFNWIDETDRVDLGMIAQEVEQIFPNLVFTNNVDGYKGIHYDKFSSILTKAIQEQQAIIETQEQKITDLETTIQSLITRIENLENK
jgi:hypothetical protein